MLVAFEAVLPSGEIVRTRPTPRGATGQDVRHLFLGAEGTAGILTELTFQVHPRPESTRSQAIAFPSMRAGLEALRLSLRAGWRPPVLRLYDDIEAGRTYADVVQSGESLLLILTEGPVALTATELEAVAAICVAAGGRVVGPGPVESWLQHRNTVPTFESFLQQNVIVDTIEVAVTWNKINELYEGVLAGMRAVPGLIVASGHSSHSYATGTNIYFTFAARPEKPEDMETLYFDIWRAAMEGTLAVGGTVSHHHGIGRVRRDWLARDLGSAYPLLGAIQRTLDPLGIMNPGALLPDRPA
jgi:alkyldihydroxyacetonephosphate synthase